MNIKKYNYVPLIFIGGRVDLSTALFKHFHLYGHCYRLPNLLLGLFIHRFIEGLTFSFFLIIHLNVCWMIIYRLRNLMRLSCFQEKGIGCIYILSIALKPWSISLVYFLCNFFSHTNFPKEFPISHQKTPLL